MVQTCFKIGNVTVRLIQGDITEQDVDVIVNAANSYLKHGGGVALAIVRKGGEIIQKESDEWVKRNGPVPEGEVAVTTAGKLKAKYVVHAVGPKFGDPEGDGKLRNAIRNSILKAEELGQSSIALPAISTGIYGYPYERCAQIMADVVKELSPSLNNLKEIRVVLWGQEAFETFRRIFHEKLSGYTSSCD
uniref:ADP-ribose-binding protein n=1 Tax=Thermofilum adornatum TaxID=1365176 RepID=A0A7C1GPI3_9CREN